MNFDNVHVEPHQSEPLDRETIARIMRAARASTADGDTEVALWMMDHLIDDIA